MGEEAKLDSAGEAGRACVVKAKPRVPKGKPSRFDPPMGSVPWRGGQFTGVWRQNGRKAKGVNQGDLSTSGAAVEFQRPRERWAGVRAPIRAMKGRNGPGAKGAQEGG